MRPLNVEEDRLDDPCWNAAASAGRDKNRLADAGAPVLQQGQGDRSTDGIAPVGRTNVPDRKPVTGAIDELGTFFDTCLSIGREQAHELLSSRLAHGRSRKRALADEIDL